MWYAPNTEWKIGLVGLGLVQTANGMNDRIMMLPSNASDFANHDPKTLMLDFVNPTGPDAIGNYTPCKRRSGQQWKYY